MANTFNDSYPPIIIDIGTSSVKYSQPILNTCKLIKEITKQKKENDNTENDIVNSNTIFNYKHCIESKPIMDYINPEEIGLETKINFDYSDMTQSSYQFSHEPIFNGLINFEHYGLIEKIIEDIGYSKYGKIYFEKELFSETPLILSQNSLPFEQLQKQITKLYETCFETFKSQSVLICSQAMINLFSHNVDSGIVVDIGESKTCITPVLNGFASYNESITDTFFSGRTITSIMCQKDNEINEDENEKINPFVSLSGYYEMDNKKKELLNFAAPHEMIKSDSSYKYNHINTLFTFPEIFRCLYRKDFRTTHYFIKNFFNSNFQTENHKFNDREILQAYCSQGKDKQNTIKQLRLQEFDSAITNFYLSRRTKAGIRINDLYNSPDNSNLINKDEIVKFRMYSLSHLILSTLEKQLSGNAAGNKINDIVLCGGVLNTPGLGELLKEDIENLILSTNRAVNIKLPPKDIDASLSFYKGANFLSKLDNLESLTVSRQDYYEVGAERLCYNYI